MNKHTENELLSELISIMARLRSENGCPWDREQTHESLVPFLLEEAYEVAAVIDSGDLGKLPDELGDVLLQIVFHARIGTEANRFDITDVISAINMKLKRRHPHVFGDVKADTSDEVLRNWQAIKAKEESRDRSESILETIAPALPPLLCAQKLQARAAEVGFDWDHIDQVREKVIEEWDELHEEIKDPGNSKRIEEEFGDLIFAMVNLARFLDIQPDEALRKANRKFRRRFQSLETRVGGSEKLAGMTLKEMDAIWDEVKADE